MRNAQAMRTPTYCQPHGGHDPAPHISVAYAVSEAGAARDLAALLLAHATALAPTIDGVIGTFAMASAAGAAV